MKKPTNLWVLGHKIQPQQITGNYDLVLGETPGNTQGPPPHMHQNYHEVFIVTEGEMNFIVDGEHKILRKGDAINLPPQATHTFTNNSSQPCRWVNIHSPKGFLSFFETFGVPEEAENAQEHSIDSTVIEQVIAKAASFDMIIQNQA